MVLDALEMARAARGARRLIGLIRHSDSLSWVHWFNEQRLHSHCHDIPPAEFEAAFYAAQQTDSARVGLQ